MRTLVAGVALAGLLTTGGAVTRQALHLQTASFYQWRCPACDAVNTTNPTSRSRVICRECRTRFEWWDVLQPLTGGARVPVEAGR